jgi:hypothetical protein
MYTLLLSITHQNLACCKYVSLDPSSSQMQAAFSQMHAPAFNGFHFSATMMTYSKLVKPPPFIA